VKVSKYKYPPYPPGRVPAAAADPVKHGGFSILAKVAEGPPWEAQGAQKGASARVGIVFYGTESMSHQETLVKHIC